MTPGWGRKRCSRRLYPRPLCVPMPRPCLDSLQIPTLRSCALHRTPRTEFVPRCVQPSCDIKHPICHCADKNYCTAETCTNSAYCRKSLNVFCPHGIKDDKDEDSVCNGPCRQQEDVENNDVEGYEKEVPACNEASCEQLKNCGIGATSNDKELIHPISYTPSATNQNSLSGIQPIAPNNKIPFRYDNARETSRINDSSLSIVGLNGKGTAPKYNHISEVNKLPNINRYIQINMQNETVSRKQRDAENLVVPEVCCSGNEVPNSVSLSESPQCNSSDVDNISVPARNIKSTFDAGTGRYDTNAQPYNQFSKTSESRFNTNVPNVDDNEPKSSNNVISYTEENNNGSVNSSINPCCKYNYGLPTSLEPKSQEELNYPGNEKLGDDFRRIGELSQQNDTLSSKSYENHQRNTINGNPLQSSQQQSPGINIDRLSVRDNSQHILSREHILPNCIHENESTNQLAKRTLTGNNSTNQGRLLNQSKNQLMSQTNNCCISEGTEEHMNSFESTSRKPPQLMSSSVANVQPTRSFTKSPLISSTSKQSSGSQLSQVRFHDNNHINNATSSSPVENQNPNYNPFPRSSRMQTNNNNNKIQSANGAFFDQKYGVICEGCQQGCCTNDPSKTGNKRDIHTYKPEPDIDCVCFKSKFLPNSKDMTCEKKAPCVIEDGTTSCSSTACIVNQNVGCNCRYPPAFKFSCTGNISGICNCNEKK